MLKKVIVTNYLGKSVEYTFEGPTIDDESGLFITEIEGLGPVKATVNMTKLATADGDIYNSSRLEGRNLVIKARFTYAKTIEEARLASYKFFPIGHKVKFHIETDNRMAETEGYVESNEPDIFSKESAMQVSVLCESPWFLSVDENGKQQTNFSNVVAMFEFPFQNLGHDPVTEFGRIINKKESTVYYDGDAETGCRIEIHAICNVEMVTIYNVKTGDKMILDTNKLETLTGHKLISGDTIIINTVKGNKFINLIRDGVTINVLNILGKDAEWFQLVKGDNLFAYTAEYGEANIQFMVETQILFEGV
jgi:hypothetical protein